MGCRLNPRHPAAAKALAIYVMSQGAGQSLHDLSGHGFMMRWRDIPVFGEQMFRWNQRAGGRVITFDNGNAMSTQNGTDWTYHKSWERTRLSIVAKYRTVANATHALVAKSEGAGGGNQKWLFYWDGDALRFLVDTAAAAAEIATALVAAGYGVGFSSAAHLAGCHQADVVVRPLADETASLTTYLLRPEGEIMEPLRQFIDRVERVGRPQGTDQRPM